MEYAVGKKTHLMDKHVDGSVQRLAIPGVHREEPKPHPHIKPLAYTNAMVGLRVFFSALFLLLLSFCAASCKTSWSL